MFVVIVLALAAIIIPSALYLTNASHRSTQISKEKMQQYYAADTGVEDALHRLGNVSFVELLPWTGNMTVNGYKVEVLIEIEEIAGQSIYRITSIVTDPLNPLSGTHTKVVADVPPILTSLTVSSGPGGNVTVTPPGQPPENVSSGNSKQFNCSLGATVNLSAIPDESHNFTGWTEDAGDTGTIGNVSAANTTIFMDKAYSIVANFQPIKYTLTIGHNGNGNVTTPGEGTFGPYDWGTTVNLEATPTPGSDYLFVSWTGNAGVNLSDPDNDGIGNITMYGNYSIWANFALTCNCFHYAAGHLGTVPTTLNNSGTITGDVFIEGSLILQTSFTLNGNLYVEGNLTLQNNSNVNGDVYVQGNLLTSNSQRIYGNAYAAGNITLEQATITQSAYSQGSISLANNAQIQGDAHYQGSITISNNSSVLGDQSHDTPVTLPPFPTTLTPPPQVVIDATATKYKNDAGFGDPITTYTGNMTINSAQSLGPKYITGNLKINNNKILTLTGTIYVEGTITLDQNAQIILGSGDPPSNPWAIVGNATGNGAITINNGAFVNTDTTNFTHVSPLPLIMSVTGGITVTGSNIGGILYAPNGIITLSGSNNVYGSVVGVKVTTSQSTVIEIAPGLEDRMDLPPCGCEEP